MTLLSAPPAQYRDRQVDFLAFDGIRYGTNVPLDMHLVSERSSGALIAGVQKLAQRFLLELLTERGSMPVRPERGSAFVTDAFRGWWRTPADVIGSFATALFHIRRTLINEETNDDPPDERFETAILETVSLLRDQVHLRIRITSRAGEETTLIHPLRLTVLPPIDN